MRCTWVSTQMLSPLQCARINTRFAVFRPTPGSVNNSAMVDGTRPPNRDTICLHASITCTALFL
jgi:hypothetical protein